MRLALTTLILAVLWTGAALAQPFAYITNTDNPAVPGTVSVIDTATNAVVATVPVGGVGLLAWQ